MCSRLHQRLGKRIDYDSDQIDTLKADIIRTGRSRTERNLLAKSKLKMETRQLVRAATLKKDQFKLTHKYRPSEMIDEMIEAD